MIAKKREQDLAFFAAKGLVQAFFSTFSKKLKPKKTQGWKKLKEIFWKTQAFFRKTQGFANLTWFLLPKNVQKVSLILLSDSFSNLVFSWDKIAYFLKVRMSFAI